MGGRECDLFYFGEIIDGVLVEGHFTESAKRNFTMWSDFGQVKDILTEFLRLFRGEDLDITCPGWEIVRFDLFEEVLCSVIGVISREFSCGFIIKRLNAL